VRRGNPGALRPRTMIFSELNHRPGDLPSSSAVAPPRDFKVINADELAEVIGKEIHDPEIAALGFTGAVDQFSDSTDLVDCPRLAHAAVRAVSLDRKSCRSLWTDES
jgi:hypothetical protein